MGLTSTTYIKCDYTKQGKPCKKSFTLPDDPKYNTKGVENTVSSKDAYGNTLFFCDALHLVAHWVEVIKQREADKESRAGKAVEELETIPQTPPMENLSLEN